MPATPVPATRVPPELLRQLGRLLTADGAEPAGSTDPRDLADVLWLARACGLRPDAPPDAPQDRPVAGLALPPLPAVDPAADEQATAAWSAALRAAVDRAAAESGTTPQPVPQGPPTPRPAEPEPVIPLHLPPAPGPPAASAAPAATVRSPARPALTGTLALSRALRPLRRTVRSTRELVLDEEATVSASGQAGLLLPVWRGAPERWLDVDLVIDGGPTMAVWSALGDDLGALLRRHGAFHRVRVWSVHDRDGAPALTPRGATAQGREFGLTADPRGRRVILLLTDGVGPLWHSGALPAAMRGWSRHAPVTVLQVLPRRHWHRTALRPVPARARLRPGERPTVVHAPEDDGWGAPGTAWAGVLELRADWLAPWARMLSGRASDWTPALAVPLDGHGTGPEPSPPADEPPAHLLARFRREASPTAYELAGLLAAAPLSLPVMRHVQAAMLRDSSAMHLAEIYLSGLLERRSPVRPGEDPETVLYDFRPGVRERLLGTLTRSESAQVLRVLAGVSQSVAGAFGGTLDFRALAALADAGSGTGAGLPAESVPFAEVAVEVLRGLGGADRALAERLAVSLPAGARAAGARAAGARAAVEPQAEATPKKQARKREPDASPMVIPGAAMEFAAWFPDLNGADEPRPERRWWQRRRPAGGETAVPPPDATRPAWNNLPPDLPDVTGWESRLVQVERILHPDGSAAGTRRTVRPAGRSLCVLQGPNHTGKTSVALAYAHLHLADYTMVWWVDGRSRDTVARSLDSLAAVHGAPPGSDVTTERNRWLTEHPGWLIVIDDLGRDFPDHERWMAGTSPRTLLGDCWPPDGYGSVLITSRVVTTERAVLDGHVLQFPAYQRRSEPRSAASTKAAEDDLAALPDVLSRATDTAVAPRTGAGREPARPAPEPPVDYGPLLAGLGGEALDALAVCAFLDLAGISVELVNHGLRASHRRGASLSPDALEQVSAARLLRLVPDGRGSLSFHMAVGLQRAVRARMTSDERKEWATTALRAVLEGFPPDPTPREGWAACTALLPHAHTVLQHPALEGDVVQPAAELLYRLARFRAAQGDYDAAEAYLRQRRTLVRGAPGTSVYAVVLMAGVLYGAGRFDQALESVEEALALPGGGTVRARRLAAAIHRERYRLDSSRSELSAAAETIRSARTPAVSDLLVEAEVHRELGLTELEAGELDVAETHLEHAWTGLLRFGSDLPAGAEVLEVAIRQDRARLSLLQGRPSLSACEVLAAAIRKAGTGQDVEGLDVIMAASETLVDVMREYLDQLKSRWEASPETYQQLRVRQLAQMAAVADAVLAYRRERAEKQPHRLAVALDMYGVLLSALGRHDEAGAALDEAAVLHRRVHGESRPHPALGENRWRLAQVLAAKGDGEEAARLAGSAHEYLRECLGPDHPRLRPIARFTGAG
ncbi:SAV_2336 N-terminal domain-related protein [Kitasatospora sp. NPDC059722]|uniref:SAV_2336 N-terminal domain-related protein n=1 Tax=Kitasatospora sp. NPDC059722 TaxID=3346925 RepID=UPI0036C7AC08